MQKGLIKQSLHSEDGINKSKMSYESLIVSVTEIFLQFHIQKC